MNKKLLTAFLFGASVLASTSTFVSCKDYDDDIKATNNKIDAEITARKALEEKVAAAQSAISALQSHETECDAAQAKALEEAKKALQNAIDAQADKEAKDVVALNAAIDKALIDAKAYTDAAIALDNEKDAATYATIVDVNNKIKDVLDKYQALSDEIAAVKGEYGSLKAALDAQKAALEKAIKDGDDATLKAALKAVEDAKKELNAHEAECDKKVDAAFTEIYKAFDAENGTLEGLKNAVSNMKVDIIDLKNYAEELKTKTIPGIEADIKKVSDDLEVMSKILSSQLRSLVFMPYLYVDGIEATRYRVLTDTVLVKRKSADIERHRKYTDDPTYEKLIGCEIGMPDKGTDKPYKLTNIYDYVEPSDPKAIFFGPTWPVDYHANPTSANIQFSEIVKNFKVLAPSVITRAAVTDDEIKKFGVTAEEFYQDGKTKVFNNNRNGELTVGIKVANPSYLFDGDPNVVVNNNKELANKDPKAVGSYESGTGHWSNGKDNTFALQVKEDDCTNSKSFEGKDTITSDYAMLYGTKVFLEGIVWNSKVGKVGDTNLEGKGYASPYTACNAGYSRQTNTDEIFYNATGRSGMTQEQAHSETGVKYRCAKHIHVYDCPEEALFDKNPILLSWKDTVGIKLEDYLALHWYEENVNRTGWEEVKTTNFTDKKLDTTPFGNPWIQYGLSYDFEFCNYIVTDQPGRATSDSKYAYWKDNKDINCDYKKDAGYVSKSGTIVAGSVQTSGEYDTVGDDDGERLTAQNKQSVHREPLVRVRVKKGEDVLLDGYILVHITDNITPAPEKLIEKSNKATFDLCNDKKVLSFDWQDFTKEILQDAFKEVAADGISKTQFDEWYGDAAVSSFEGAADGDWANARPHEGGGYYFDCDLFASASATAEANKGTYGRVEYLVKESGTTNAEFSWYLTAEELEEITHNTEKIDGKDKGKGTASVYIRFTGKAGAPYKYLWVKLTATITREEIVKYGIAAKNRDYWFDAKTGANDGLSAVVLNVNNPNNGDNCATWINPLRNNFLRNEVLLTKNGALPTATCHSKTANLATMDEDMAAGALDGYSSLGNTQSHVTVRAKFYFTPETTTYTKNLKHATTYTLYPQNTDITAPVYTKPTLDSDYDKLIPRYYSHKLAASTSYFTGHDDLTTTPALPTCKLDQTKHEWKSEANANEVVKACAIDYNAGVYKNNALYAKVNSSYVLVATLDQQTGDLELLHYDEGTLGYKTVCDILNSIGYVDDQHSNIADELRAKTGIIAYDKCTLATQMDDATWLNSFQRPVNVEPIAEKAAIDARTNGNFIYMADILRLYDYRGPVKGSMEGKDNKWLWAYYNVHYITVDCTPSKVQTNMHLVDAGLDGKWVTMDKINPKYLALYADSARNQKVVYNFDLRNKGRYNANYTGGPAGVYANANGNIAYERNFNCGHKDYPGYHDVNNPSWSKCGASLDYDYATRSAALFDIFDAPAYTYVNKTSATLGDGTVVMEDIKAKLGYIWYDNNMNNVTPFQVIVPITIGYEWGCFTTNVTITIDPTLGNQGTGIGAKKRK